MTTPQAADAESGFLVINVTPDFCWVFNAILPFEISRCLTEEMADYSENVRARGEKVLKEGSQIRGVTGDAGKGLFSNTSKDGGHSTITRGAKNVRVNGKAMGREGDPAVMNSPGAGTLTGNCMGRVCVAPKYSAADAAAARSDLERLWKTQIGQELSRCVADKGKDVKIVPPTSDPAALRAEFAAAQAEAWKYYAMMNSPPAGYPGPGGDLLGLAVQLGAKGLYKHYLGKMVEAGGKLESYNRDKREVTYDPGTESLGQTANGHQPISGACVLAHELGHACEDKPVASEENEMEVIDKYQNRCGQEVGDPVRTRPAGSFRARKP